MGRLGKGTGFGGATLEAARGIGLLILFGSLVLAAASCTKSVSSEEDAPAKALKSIERRIENTDYQAVIEEATSFLLRYPGNKDVDRVTYLLAEAYLESGDFAEAESRFAKVYREFPESEYADDAYFMLGETFLKQSRPAPYDQEMTWKALRQFGSFLELFPASSLAGKAREKVRFCRSRLAEKRYLSARLYYKLGYYEVAARYFRSVAEKYPDTDWGRKSLLEAGKALERLGRKAEAEALYRKLRQSRDSREAPGMEASKRLSGMDE